MRNITDLEATRPKVKNTDTVSRGFEMKEAPVTLFKKAAKKVQDRKDIRVLSSADIEQVSGGSRPQGGSSRSIIIVGG